MSNIYRLCKYLGVFGLGAALFIGCLKPRPESKSNEGGNGAATVSANEGQEVHGSVMVQLSTTNRLAKNGMDILLPDFELFLLNRATAVESPPQKTDLYGHFIFPPVKPGVYELRWKAQGGWAAGVYS